MLSFFDRSVERLEKVRDMAVAKMNEIISTAKAAKVAEETTAVATVEETEAPFETEAESDGEVKAEKETTPPEPAATRPRIVRGAKEGKVNKSELIRDFFRKHPDAANKDCIEFYKKKNIEIHGSLVSIVKSAGAPTGKRRGRPAKVKASAHAAVARAKKVKTAKRGLPMTACIARVVKAKEGMRIDKIVEGIKKFYTYGGKQDDDGLRNVVYQGLYALSKKKAHRGWKGEVPVVLHDEESHTWRLNPKAERKSA